MSRLKSHLRTKESERFGKKKIARTGLSILDAVHCVADRKRTLLFLGEIRKLVHKNSLVLEAGVGTGVLSVYAAIRGAKVRGVELNPATLKLAQRTKKNFSDIANINFVAGNAIKFHSKQKYDLIINENIYTGLFFEKQVEISNNLQRFLKPQGEVLPRGITNTFRLCRAFYPKTPHHKELFVRYEEGKKPIPLRYLSGETVYNEIDFKKNNRLSVHGKAIVQIGKNGLLNGIRISSYVNLPSGRIIDRLETKFLNNDIVLAVVPSVEVKRGDKVGVSLDYSCGDNPKTARVLVIKLGK